MVLGCKHRYTHTEAHSYVTQPSVYSTGMEYASSSVALINTDTVCVCRAYAAEWHT